MPDWLQMVQIKLVHNYFSYTIKCTGQLSLEISKLAKWPPVESVANVTPCSNLLSGFACAVLFFKYQFQYILTRRTKMNYKLIL